MSIKTLSDFSQESATVQSGSTTVAHDYFKTDLFANPSATDIDAKEWNGKMMSTGIETGAYTKLNEKIGKNKTFERSTYTL
jgi:hypothetical protein